MKIQVWLLRVSLWICCCTPCGCSRGPDQEAKQPELVLASDPPIKNQEPPPEPKETPKENPAKSEPAPKAKNTGGGALGQTIDFLGSQATGNRFCIIADRSLSLTPNSFQQIKKEILRTLRNLHESSQFHVLVFAKVPESMPGEPWLHGGKDVDKIVPWLDSLPRLLGTKGGPPFHQAFALKPRPDVIFFLTDGIIPAKDPERIAAMNKAKPRTVINTILFNKTGVTVAADDPARGRLERIAKDNGGTFHQFLWKEPDKKGK